MSRATIKDLAKKLGVSPSTISRALSDHPDISENMKEKVRLVAEELNYTKNRRASGLRKNESNIIALIIPEINMFFMPELIYGVNLEAEKFGLSVAIFQSDNSLEKEKELLKYCLEMSFCGVLLCLSVETKNLSHIDKITKKEMPVVLLDKVLNTQNYSTITIEDELAGYQAAEYLHQKGHSSILSIFGNPDLSITHLRKNGFNKALQNYTDFPSKHISLEIENILSLDSELETILTSNKNISAIFCMSDELLVNTHHLLMRMEYKIPEQISLLSISDGFVPYYLYPNISHLHHSGFEVGVVAVNELLENQTDNPNHINVKTKLFEMESVKEFYKAD